MYSLPLPSGKKSPGEGSISLFFPKGKGRGCTHAFFYLYLCCHDTFQLQVTQRSTRKGPHWKWYNVGKQKQNCSHSFTFGEVTFTSLFLKMYLYKPSLGSHWLFPVQPWRRANPSRWSLQPNDCQSHTEMTSGFHGTWQRCCEGTSFPRMK